MFRNTSRITCNVFLCLPYALKSWILKSLSSNACIYVAVTISLACSGLVHLVINVGCQFIKNPIQYTFKYDR